jgi:mono/diheme cytochrome c family protein
MQVISTRLLCAAVFCAQAVLTISAHAAAPSKEDSIKAGQQVFTTNCFQCHSVQPDQVRFGPSLYNELKKPHPKKTDAEVREILKSGKNKMPAFGEKLSKQETDDLLSYLHTL